MEAAQKELEEVKAAQTNVRNDGSDPFPPPLTPQAHVTSLYKKTHSLTHISRKLNGEQWKRVF